MLSQTVTSGATSSIELMTVTLQKWVQRHSDVPFIRPNVEGTINPWVRLLFGSRLFVSLFFLSLFLYRDPSTTGYFGKANGEVALPARPGPATKDREDTYFSIVTYNLPRRQHAPIKAPPPAPGHNGCLPARSHYEVCGTQACPHVCHRDQPVDHIHRIANRVDGLEPAFTCQRHATSTS